MNAYANPIVSYLLAQSWQVALLAAIVGLTSLALRNRSAHLRYLLWLIVLAKCLVPPLLAVPLAVLPERHPSPFITGVALQEEHSAPEAPVSVGGAAPPQELKPAVPSARELMALVWAAGAFFFLLWVGGRAVRYASWLRDRRRPLPPTMQESIREPSAGFKFRKWPRIWLVEDISQPFVWGLLRGSVYLPADFVGLSGSDRQRSVLAHELSHVARFDAGVNLLQVVAQALYWFHPLVWWTNRRIRQEREKCCDEMAVAHLNAPPEHYTEAIVDALAAERRSAHPIPSLAIVGSVKDIEERIKTMLRPGRKFHKRPSLVAATVTLLIAFVTIPTALVLTARGQMQPANQTTSQAAADSEKPEQPRFAARTFNSKMAFYVFVHENLDWSWNGSGGKLIGRTPSDTPLQIPACWVWFVQPMAPVEDWDLLLKEMSQNSVPGLRPVGTIGDSGLTRLAGCTGLQFLDLSYTRITDADVAHLRDLTGLQYLTLMGSSVTDAGLQYLKEVKGLRYVNLWNTRITDAGLVHLKGMTGLQGLNLNNTKITGAGLELLRGLSGLQKLHVRNTQVTDADLIHLKGLTELRSLDFIGVGITSLGLEHLKGLTKLRELNLGRTKVTDSGLAHLAGLTGLTALWSPTEFRII
jgi:beta-lactamase regulating signal transducer with metallopeptidase domain